MAGVEADIERRTGLRTWIEIDASAIARNYAFFRSLVGEKVKLWSVVKSNAYGHGIAAFSKIADSLGVDGFCVDSLVEGLRLRKEGISKPILVLGHTLPELFSDARAAGIAVSLSSFPMLEEALAMEKTPDFHIKIDTGMHRQGFYPEQIGEVVRAVTGSGKSARLKGIFTHFASAKDLSDRSFTDRQMEGLSFAQAVFANAGMFPCIHASATGGTLCGPAYHCDAVRVGIGLYGLFPSRELETQLPLLDIAPALSWKTVLAEVKPIRAGEAVGYDLSERVDRDTKIAVLPVGYWHGLPRSLSGVGEVLIKGQPAKILGKVSMDMTVVDVGDIDCRHGDIAVLIGTQNGRELRAQDVASRAGTVHYELLTRLNPLIERIVV